MFAQDEQEYYFLFAKNKDDLANTTYKYETQYRGNISDIHNGVGDQNHIALTGMVP